MVRVLFLHPERSCLSDSLSKACVIHVVLPIAVTWRGVDEPTLEAPFLFSKRKEKKRKKSLLGREEFDDLQIFENGCIV